HQRAGQRAREAEQAQVEHHRRADEHDEPDDVNDLDGRVEPEPSAHGRGDARALEPDEPRGALVRHRSSVVLPSMMMRSARISFGSVRLGYPTTRAFVPGFSIAADRPRFSMRDGGASVTFHVLPGA